MKISYIDFIAFFGKERFDNDFIQFINQFGIYKLKSNFFPNDITYFEETGTYNDSYCNDSFGFELIFEEPGFYENKNERYPKNLVLTEIIFYLENLNLKNSEDGFLCRYDTNTMMKSAFPDKVFKGLLPGNIAFRDNKNQIFQKLGLPLSSDRINNFDTFITEDNKLIIKAIYHDNSNLIRFLTICPVEYEKSSNQFN
jgi:hypothetical protein